MTVASTAKSGRWHSEGEGRNGKALATCLAPRDIPVTVYVPETRLTQSVKRGERLEPPAITGIATPSKSRYRRSQWHRRHLLSPLRSNSAAVSESKPPPPTDRTTQSKLPPAPTTSSTSVACPCHIVALSNGCPHAGSSSRCAEARAFAPATRYARPRSRLPVAPTPRLRRRAKWTAAIGNGVAAR